MVPCTPVALSLACLFLVTACVPQGAPAIEVAASEAPVNVALTLPPVPALVAADRPGEIDARIIAASRRLETYCASLQVAALGASLFGKEKMRRAAAMAAKVMTTVCAHPPGDVASALLVAARAYESIRQRRGGP